MFYYGNGPAGSLVTVLSGMGLMRHCSIACRNQLTLQLATCGRIRARAPAQAGMWVCLFIFSKYIELVDTFFLVVRKLLGKLLWGPFWR